MTLKNKYMQPTPKKWRRLGDALLGASTMITTYAIADDLPKWISITALMLGVVGKFLSNLFTESNETV